MGTVNDEEHFVAWLDLLGFKAVLDEATPARAVKLIRDQVPRILQLAMPNKSHGPDGLQLGVPRCEVEHFQDTLVLWTWGVKSEDLEVLLKVVREVQILMSSNGIACRGGIAKGTLYTARLDPFAPRFVNATLGRAILRAYDVENRAKWAGVVIHESIHQDEGLRHEVLEPMKGAGTVCRYSVPGLDLKHGSEGTHWVLGWPIVPSDLDFEKSFAKLWPQRPVGDDHETKAAQERYDNTKAFHQWWCEAYHRGLKSFPNKLDELLKRKRL